MPRRSRPKKTQARKRFIPKIDTRLLGSPVHRMTKAQLLTAGDLIGNLPYADKVRTDAALYSVIRALCLHLAETGK